MKPDIFYERPKVLTYLVRASYVRGNVIGLESDDKEHWTPCADRGENCWLVTKRWYGFAAENTAHRRTSPIPSP